MKTIKLLAILGLWSLSIMGCSEKVETTPTPVTPTTPITPSTPTTSFFTDPTMKKANLVSVSFASDQILYAFGNDASKGYLFKSTDLGKTWTEVKFSDANPIMQSVSFKDEKVGILNGKNVLGTIDGGTTWTLISRPTDAQQTVYPKSQEGLILMRLYDNFHSKKYTEVHSINTANLSHFNYVTLGGYINDVHFLKDKLGIFVGEVGAIDVILAKADGTYDYIDQVKPVSEDLLSVYLISDKKAFVGGKNSTFLKTVDGGINWTVIKTGVAGDVSKLAFQTENLGYGIVVDGAKTNLYKIEDAGTKWTKITTPDTAIFNDLKINSQGKAIAVGKDGGVYLF
ncbi:YCF48-related protein [Arcicella sp. LKC2W]|uniref:WD40/YVTN/BNR-like repeat-containing protein n=1 Tax=Arcicella sp. LKC2W TaxID=2984198 RepID=UPI002B21395F|nr:YCF48-related protein [Arcicella sp. LKC2W]MEA5459388.1 YCF48-related protein [Arcicella sp. LKC2W]